jgi:mRNA interferase RelE/StbE
MGITLLIAGAYLAAMLVTAWFLPDGILRKPVLHWENLVVVAFLLFWPIWAALIAYRRMRARSARPAYLDQLRELDELTLRYKMLERQFDELMEQLAEDGDETATGQLLTDLADLTRAREETQSRLVNVHAEAKRLHSVHGAWWGLEAPAPLYRILPPVMPMPFRRSDEPEAVTPGGTSRIRLHVFSDDETGDNWDLESAVDALREHLAAPEPEETDAPGERLSFSVDRYMRSSEARDRRRPARSSTWEAVFTSSFKKSLRKAGRDIEEKAYAAIAELVVNPVEPRGSTIKPLSGNYKGLWRYRIGEFRLVYQPVADEGELRLISLTHRREAY